jgi:DNA-binding LytR/AlgR family response regulator
LGDIEKLIDQQLGNVNKTFVRIGRGLIINCSYIYCINITKQRLILSDCRGVSHTVTASREALKQLKELLEKEAK